MYQTFNVRIVLNGLLVRVGCQYLLFRTVDSFADALKEYLANPQRTIDWYLSNSWSKISNSNVCQPAAYPASSDPDMGDGSAVEVAIDTPPPPPPPQSQTASTEPYVPLRGNPGVIQ